MPEITIPESVIKQVKNRFGPYSKLKVPPPKVITFSDVLLPIIEATFREYARAHKGCSKDMEDKEWKNFLSKLKKRL